MQNPRVTISRRKLTENITYLTDYCRSRGIEVAAVTKVFNAYPEMVALYDGVDEIKFLGDSRIENFASYPADSTKEKLLLRIPMLSEAAQVVRETDISLNSSIETIRALNQHGAALAKQHKIILMIDLGDLREGIFDESELFEYIAEIKEMAHIELYGLGTNLTCYGAVIPTKAILQKLVDHRDQLEKTFDIKISVLSGGNSSSLYLLKDQQMPEGINMLRIGEAFLLGFETAYAQAIPNMHQDVFRLYGEIVEYRDKPSAPIGKVGQNAFGDTPDFEDKGLMKRGIIALGLQDVDHTRIIPIDPRLEIIGSSSDHIIIDFTAAAKDYAIGDEVAFSLEYGSLLSVFTSKYVKKYII